MSTPQPSSPLADAIEQGPSVALIADPLGRGLRARAGFGSIPFQDQVREAAIDLMVASGPDQIGQFGLGETYPLRVRLMSARLGPRSGDFGRNLPIPGQHWSNFVHLGSKLVQVDPAPAKVC